MSTLNWLALVPAQKPYRIRLLFTHKNRDLGTDFAPTVKVDRHVWDRFLRHSSWQYGQVFIRIIIRTGKTGYLPLP